MSTTVPQAGATVVVEKRKRGVFGWIVAVAFWGWQALMLVWLIAALGATGDQYAAATSEAARTGTAIGATIGFTFLLMVWAFGSVILGMLMFVTRGKKILITQGSA